MTRFNQVDFNSANQSAFGTLETNELTPVIQSDWVYGINKQLWQYNYTFTITAPAAYPVAGDIYTNSNNSFTVIWASGTTLVAAGTGDPAASGNLTRATGSGTTPIAYSAFSQTPGVYSGAGALIDTDTQRLRIQSGTGSAGYAYIVSRRPVRYRAGQGTTVRFTPLFTSGVANNIQLWGMGSIASGAPYDGYFFGYNGTSFGIAHYVRGSATWTAQGSWNGNKVDGSTGSAFTLDPTKGTPVMIKYPFLGYGDIQFFVQNPTSGAWVLVHIIRYANTTNTTQLSNPTMYFIGFTLNSGNTSNVIMYCASIGAFVSGARAFVSSPKNSVDVVSSAVTSTESCLLNIRNARTMNGMDNRGIIRLTNLSLGLKEATVVTIRFKVGAIIGGTPSWAAVDGTISNNGLTITSGNSTVSYDSAGTTVAGGRQIHGMSIGASGTVNESLIPFEIFLSPGEQLTISAVATGNSTVGISLSWSEDI